MSRVPVWATLAIVVPACLLGEPVLAAEPTQRPVLTPEQAVTIAFERSPVLAASGAQARQAGWALLSESARFDPVLVLDAGATRTQSPTFSISGTSLPRTDQATAGASLQKKLALGTDVSLRVAGTWQKTQLAAMPGQNTLLELGPGYGLSAKFGVAQPLLRGAGSEVNRSSIMASSEDRKTADLSNQLAASTLARDTLQAYAELWYAARNVQLQRKSLEVATEQRDTAAQRERTGSVAPADVLSFETTVASRQESVLDAEREQSSRVIELMQVMGGSSDFDFALVDELGLPPSEEGDIVGEALAHSVELRQVRSALEASTIRARTAADPQRSRLDLDAYVQVQGLGNNAVYPAVSQFVGGNAWSAHVGVTYELPIGEKWTAEQRKAQAMVDAARKSLEATQVKTRANVENMMLQERAARSRAVFAERTVTLARKAADAQRGRMQTGSATALQVIESDNQERSAEVRLLRATVDAYQAVIALRHVTGRLALR